MICLHFPIDPIAKQRSRVVRNGGKVHSFTPAKTKNFENHVKLLTRKQFKKAPLEGALKLRVWFYLRKPKTVKRLKPSVKPDLDNYVKAFKDALNGIVWNDDAQVTEIYATKAYAQGEPVIYCEIEPDTF